MAELEDFTEYLKLHVSMFFMMHDDNNAEIFVHSCSGPINDVYVEHGQWVATEDEAYIVTWEDMNESDN